MKKIALLFSIFFFMASLCSAETIYLKNGRVIKGTVVQKTDDKITVNSSGIELTYFADEIDRIEGSAAVATPEPLTVPVLQEAVAPKPNEIPKTEAPAVLTQGGAEEQAPLDKKTLILKYMEVTGAKANMQTTFADIINSADPAKKDALAQTLNLDDIISQLIPVYEKYFTEQDLQELIAFYESRVARKLFEVEPLLLKDVMETSRQYLEGKIE